MPLNILSKRSDWGIGKGGFNEFLIFLLRKLKALFSKKAIAGPITLYNFQNVYFFAPRLRTKLSIIWGVGNDDEQTILEQT